jgi:hypothetical protein
MIRGALKFNNISQFPRSSCCLFSTQTAKKEFVSFQDEWNSAKSYDEIPKPSALKMIRGFLPGGDYEIEISEKQCK